MSESILFATEGRFEEHEQACAICVQRCNVPPNLPCAHATIYGTEYPNHPEWANLTLYVRGVHIKFIVPEGTHIALPEPGPRSTMLFDDLYELPNGPGMVGTLCIEVFGAQVKWPDSHVFVGAWYDPRGQMQIEAYNLQHLRPGRIDLDNIGYARAFIADQTNKGRRKGTAHYNKRDELEGDILKVLMVWLTQKAPYEVTQSEMAIELDVSLKTLQNDLSRFHLSWRGLKKEAIKRLEKERRAAS
jgi:hypothetical protein